MKFPKAGLRLHRVTRLLVGSLTICLLTGLFPQPGKADGSTPATPVLIDRNTAGRAGDWWQGATPAGPAPSTPVLVFVAGLHCDAQDWYEETRYSGINDMYADAYAAGYRTAFVDLADADGEARSMWVNGEILADTLRAIADHYGVEKVNVVAHSKGGIDTNAAIAFYGADSRVGRVFTLSSPHRGSPLANLAYSYWGGWLAELMGMRDEGTYVLQTGYMEWFRSVADGQSADQHVDYYTVDGTNWGPLGSALWFGGLYLSGAAGRSDGAVPISKATKPGAVHVATLPYNHDNIRMGQNTWPLISGYVFTLARAGTVPIAQPALLPADRAMPGDEAGPAGDTLAGDDGVIMRGGPLTGRTVTQFPVESGALKLDVSLLSSTATPAVLVDPDGHRWRLAPGAKGDGLIFPGAASLGGQILLPKAGVWQLEMLGPDQGAYLLTVRPQSDLAVRVGLADGAVGTTGERLTVPVAVTGRAAGVKPTVTLQVGHTTPGEPTRWLSRVQLLADAPGAADAAVDLPAAPALLNVSGTVTGTLPDGTPFERSFVRSVAVKPAGADAATSLRGLGQQP